MKHSDDIYLRRLARCSTEQLVGLRKYLAAKPRTRRTAWMLGLVATALLARVGLTA